MKIRFATFILLLALLFMPSSSAQAQGPGGDIFLLGQNYTLESDDALDGSLAVVGGNAKIEEDATVNGDVALIGGNLTVTGEINGNVALIGGNLTVSGEVNGDLVVIGGQILLTETAVVRGDVVTMGGQVTKEPGAEVSGEIVNNAPPVAVPDVPGAPQVPNTPGFNISINPFWEIASVFGRALAVAAIGMLLALFLQPQMERVGDAVTHQPFMAGSFGLLAVILTPLAIVIMTVTIILIPVAILVAFIIPLAWLFGAIALGQEVGERFTRAINQSWAPVLATGFGTFLLMLVGGFVELIPCVGWLLPLIIGLMGIGGVAMTWFGTRSTPGSTVNAQVVEVPPAS
ncbi:MAG: polymer-forming cytoskeletal protein [Chloroflexi bacterium]|nr:polymer-forming cytoskeletal protein [Chloroflexota bacterium]